MDNITQDKAGCGTVRDFNIELPVSIACFDVASMPALTFRRNAIFEKKNGDGCLQSESDYKYTSVVSK